MSLAVAKTNSGRDVVPGLTYSYAPTATEDTTTVTFPGGRHNATAHNPNHCVLCGITGVDAAAEYAYGVSGDASQIERFRKNYFSDRA